MIFGEFNNSREIEVAKAIRIQINIYTNKQARYIYKCTKMKSYE